MQQQYAEARDIVSALHDQRDAMSKSEKRIADAVLADMHWAMRSTTNELAERAATSTPTITRFCRRVGCSGLRDFKLQLAQASAVGQRYLVDRVGEIDTEGATKQVIHGAQQALELLLQQLDPQRVDEAVDWLATADRIVVFGGGGGASIVAQDTEYRLFRLGLNVTACNDVQLQQMLAATLKSGDVLLVVSTSGRYQESPHLVEVAHAYDARSIAITRPNSPLGQSVQLLLPVDIPEDPEVLKPTASRYALLAVIDILATELAVRQGEIALENLRRIKHHLVAVRDRDDTQPLGD